MLTAVFDISWIFWLFVVAQFFVPLYQKQMRFVGIGPFAASSSGARPGSSR